MQMLEDSLKTPHRLIGMLQPRSTAEGAKELQRVGCAGRITQFSENDDGRMLITLTGVSRFRVVGELDGFTPYRRCRIDWSSFDRDLGKPETDSDLNRKDFLDLLDRYFESCNLSADWDSLKDADNELLVNSLSMLLDFTPEDKQALLEAPSLQVRRKTLTTLIEFLLRGGNSEDAVQ